MALHRDIFWIGRQWAVTGCGLQLIDQRLKGVFDIEVAHLWDERALDGMRAHDWLKAEDFANAIAAARKRFPAPPSPELSKPLKTTKPVQAVAALVTSSAPDSPAPLHVPVHVAPPIQLLSSGSETATAELPSKPALPVETLSWPSQLPNHPVAPAAVKLPPSAVDFRTESERARADLQSKMSALDGLLRSRGAVVPQPVVPPPSILPVRAEGELAKFAPQWRVRN